MKNKKILITIILVLLLVIIGIGAYYVVNSDKIKFEKNIIETGENFKKVFEDTNLVNYIEKKQKASYESNGTLNIKVNTNELDIHTDLAAFSGKVDNMNKRAEREIKIGSSIDPILATYLQDGEIYALSVDNITDGFLSVENNKLKELAEKIGLEDENIPDKIEKQYFKQEDMSLIMNKYLKIIMSNTKKENYTKNKDEQQNTYSLKIEAEQLKIIERKILTQLKEDQDIKDTININEDEYKKYIDDILLKVEDEDYSNKYVKITSYSIINNTAQLMIETEEIIIKINCTNNEKIVIKLIDKNAEETEITEIDFTIEKNITENTSKYVINISTIGYVEYEISGTIEIKNYASNNIEENYSISLKSTEAQEYYEGTLKNNVVFKEKVDTLTLENEKTTMLNNCSEDELKNVLQTFFVRAITTGFQKAQNDDEIEIWNLIFE